MELAVIGISHRTASLALRERVAFRVEQACEATDQLRARGVLKEAVILSTCNRTEVYGVARERSGDILQAMEMFVASYHRLAPAEMGSAVYRHSDRDLVRHLYRVAAGLDSLLFGESETLGRAREAYRVAMDYGSNGRVLNPLVPSAAEACQAMCAETRW